MPMDGDETHPTPWRESGSRHLPGGAWIMLTIWGVGLVYLFVDLMFFRD